MNRPIVNHKVSIGELMATVAEARAYGADAELADRMMAALMLLPELVAKYRDLESPNGIHEGDGLAELASPSAASGDALRLSFFRWVAGEIG